MFYILLIYILLKNTLLNLPSCSLLRSFSPHQCCLTILYKITVKFHSAQVLMITNKNLNNSEGLHMS
jgi:hypothetical protein